MSIAMRRPGGNWSVSRPDKLADYQTVLYEVDMLRFAYSRVIRPLDEAKEGDVWINLECFLVHYRNLLDFFGKPPRRDSDLTISRPDVIWDANLGLNPRRPSAEILDRIQTVGRNLWEKYENGKQRTDTISRYLQHCTTFRTTFKDWFPVEMMAEIKEAIESFEQHLPKFTPATSSGPVDRAHFLGGPSFSTHSQSTHSGMASSVGGAPLSAEATHTTSTINETK
jgi:hypothetical protein